jgi:hypothetical protein
MPKRTYTSHAAPGTEGDETISTEGVAFELDGVEFTCHGQMDANDLVELAPLLDAGEGQWLDPAALAAVGHFYSQVMGRATWAQFSAHRRAHRTPPSVIAQIMMDLIQEVVDRPPARPSPSPSGPQTTGASSPAGSPSPASPGERLVRLPPNQAADPEGIIPRELAALGDVVLAPPPPAEGWEDPMAGTHRVINLGKPPDQVRFEEAPA